MFIQFLSILIVCSTVEAVFKINLIGNPYGKDHPDAHIVPRISRLWHAALDAGLCSTRRMEYKGAEQGPWHMHECLATWPL